LHCNSEKTTRGEKRRKLSRERKDKPIVSEKECRLMKKRKWAA